MKKGKDKLLALIIASALILTGCGEEPSDPEAQEGDLGGFDDTYGDELGESGIYDGYFEGDSSDLSVNCVSGTADAYTLDSGVLTFSNITEDSVYSVSGKLKGRIVIDIGDEYKLDLELHGLSLVSDSDSAITVLSGDEVSITAKKGYKSYIYDKREAIAEEDSAHSATVFSEVDLEICGKGALTVVSDNNNGIHTKDDLQVKNLTLFVYCVDNALKGNDGVEITDAVTTLIATRGDGIKTSSSDISEKGNRRGIISIVGGEHTVFAACDGIDAAYDAVIDGETTVLNIYTDKYSNYSEEITATDESSYYIRFTSDAYLYSVKYYNSESDYLWVNAEYHSSVSGGRNNYHYYSFPKHAEYAKMQFFIYSSDMEQGQDSDYLVGSDYLTPSEGYDTFALTSSGGGLYYSWTNYTTNIQEGPGGFGPGGMGGPGGMQDGNSDKGDHSTKGIKAANEVRVLGGIVTVKAYDDAIHANADTTLENGEAPAGNVTVSGGSVTVYSNDDGLHADGTLTVSGGTVRVTNSYEGAEGKSVVISGGSLSIIASDDGINATATTGTAVDISGGEIYIYCGGDGIDSNSRASYTGLVFSGGRTVVISTSGGNSAIDTEQGYSYMGGLVLAVMPSGGMSSEATHCQSFSSIGISKTVSLSEGKYLTVKVDGDTAVSVKMPKDMSSRVIYLGSQDVSVSSESKSAGSENANGVCWIK